MAGGGAAAASGAFGASALSAGLAGAGIAGGLNLIGQHSANQTNMEIANANNATAIELANTSVQRRVKDLLAAGLSPMLAYNSQAQSPQLQQARVENPVRDAVASAQQAYMQAKEREAIDATIDKTRAEAMNQRAQAGFTDSQRTDKMPAEIQNLLSQAGLNEAQQQKAYQEIGAITASIKKMEAETLESYGRGAKISQETSNLVLDNDTKRATLPYIVKLLSNDAYRSTLGLVAVESMNEAQRTGWRKWLADNGITFDELARVTGNAAQWGWILK